MAPMRQSGFTLIELTLIIVVLGILAAVAVPRMGAIMQDSKIEATRAEMSMIKNAIVGNPAVVAGGAYVDVGYEGDTGILPAALSDLAVKPGGISPYDKLTGRGWNGPYIDTTDGSYLTDAWGAVYQYDPVSRTLISTGGPETITVTF